MRSVKTVELPAWAQTEQAQAVMKALNDEGALQTLYVGGCVRNHLLGVPVSDIDLATVHTPEQAISRLQRAGFGTVPTGIDHGTVTAIAEGLTFEVTSLRRDVSTDGRRAVVAYTDDWVADAQRRDFTINTLLMSQQGQVYDPTGCGLADLEARRVVFVGNPAERIAEDYLRILRFFRFHATYGRGNPDQAGLAACTAGAAGIDTLSRERITQEILKLLALAGAGDTLSVMVKARVAARFYKADLPLDRVIGYFDMQSCNRAVHALARLAVTVAFDHDFIKENFALSNAQILFLKNMASAIEELQVRDRCHIRQSVYAFGNEATAQALLFCFAQGQHETDGDESLLALAKAWRPPAFPLAGADVLASGIKAGPAVGRILAQAEIWWRAADFVPDRAACLAWLQRHVSQQIE
ncbi:MAG: CCA tRNA nucleotidyltransferase [Micavibrio aeruginosavorus]|uniref:CCA tRNA nucleotidyltransferase n=1 Tax=Micavibrio aeruginosavorus TaxID=349221 RepID=A0A7T5UG38_9BACT|nr:MAG: CCA tRNA nucleotidyltransferase [Micavibrio aeruginosavorus]